jgi:hypothetical protein
MIDNIEANVKAIVDRARNEFNPVDKESKTRQKNQETVSSGCPIFSRYFQSTCLRWCL